MGLHLKKKRAQLASHGSANIIKNAQTTSINKPLRSGLANRTCSKMETPRREATIMKQINREAGAGRGTATKAEHEKDQAVKKARTDGTFSLTSKTHQHVIPKSIHKGKKGVSK